ncbi:MAG: hypothetical protein QN129_01880 [Armatimonadota bacterium]|nr:hypothetical protein [Armatimonadota bacterium]MDR7503636.1 hypothetical protein [Armatimonadota bacterium]
MIGVIALVGIRPPMTAAPPAASAPAPAQNSCVTCHTSATALAPLVRPFPALPAEGEG